jgi:histidinol-phosphate aminotransferase
VILAGIGRSVLTVRPTFAVYAAQARLMGADLVEVPLASDFTLPVADLLGEIAQRRGVLFLVDPAAPTGNATDPAAIERVLTAAHASGSWLAVIDEAYSEFAGSDHGDLVKRLPSAVSLHTFSKAAGLAGARIGYALTSPAVATHLRKVLLPFSVSAMQVAVGLTVLDRPDVTAARVAGVVDERRRVIAALQRLPEVEVFPSVTNFVLFKVSDPASVHRALLDSDIIVRRQDHLPGAEGCLRVSIGTPAENDAFLAAVGRAVAARRVEP